MICTLCNRDITSVRKIKRGHICEQCYDKLPESFKNSLKIFNADKLRNAMKLIKPARNTPWAVCSGVGICNDTIQINGFEISISDIASLRLNFHPKRRGNSKDTVYGNVSLIVETLNPHMQIEEPFFNTNIKYYISEKKIYYSYPSNIQYMFSSIQNNITAGIYNTLNIKEAAARLSGKKKNENQTNKNQEHEKKSQTKEERTRSTQPPTEFDRAKKLYEVEIPFTKDQLQKKKRHLLKIYHPDVNGGSEAMTKKINIAYDLLLKYAD